MKAESDVRGPARSTRVAVTITLGVLAAVTWALPAQAQVDRQGQCSIRSRFTDQAMR